MSWAGIDEEVIGIQKAWVNLRGDSAGIAAYVYDRLSDYSGPNHPATCRILLQRLVDVVAGDSLRQPSAEDA